MTFLIIFLGILFSFIFGFCIGRCVSDTDGMFIIDDDDPKTTNWILDMNIDPDSISNKKEIRLKVKKKH